MNSPEPIALPGNALTTELERLRRQLAFVERTEAIAHIGHFHWDYASDRLESCSSEYARIHGMSVEEVLEAHGSWQGVLAQIHPDDREAFEATEGDLRRDKSVDVRFRIILPDGEIRHLREYTVEVADEAGQATGTFGFVQDISHMARYERDLEYRDELARQTETVTDIGHFIFDEVQGRYVYLSEGAARIFGYTPEEYIARVNSHEDDLADVVPEDRERVAEEYRAAIETGQECALEFRIHRRDGEVRWVRELTRGKQFRDGRVVQTLGVVQDITERVGHEKELLFKDALAQQAELITDLGYFLYNSRDEQLLFISEGHTRLLGISAAEYREQIHTYADYLERVHPEDRDRLMADYQAVDDGLESGWENEYRILRADREWRWLHEVGRVHRTDARGVIEVIGVVQDVTARRQLESDLQYKNAVNLQAESITAIGHFVYDEIRQKYLYVSPGLARIHGRDADDLMQERFNWEGDLDVIHPDDRGHVRKVYGQFLSGLEEWQVEYRMLRADGTVRWVREMGRAYRVAHGIAEQTIGVLQDITEQKSAEQEIIRARDTLEERVVERTRELAATVQQLEQEIEKREQIAAELDFLANHDALTGLPSLRLCKDRLNQSLAEARRNRQTSAVMFLDLDGFKAINDDHGHEIGDLVLKETADRIKAEIRETDTVARIGGDEFVIILTSLPQVAIADRIAGALVQRVAEPIQIKTLEVAVGASIGISLYPLDGTTAEELIRAADAAMYRIKHSGKNDFGYSSGPGGS